MTPLGTTWSDHPARDRASGEWYRPLVSSGRVGGAERGGRRGTGSADWLLSAGLVLLPPEETVLVRCERAGSSSSALGCWLCGQPLLGPSGRRHQWERMARQGAPATWDARPGQITNPQSGQGREAAPNIDRADTCGRVGWRILRSSRRSHRAAWGGSPWRNWK